MRYRTGAKRKVRMLFPATALPLLLIVALAPPLRSQSPAPPPDRLKTDQLKADRPRFDVASVKANKSGAREYSNVPLRAGVLSPPNGGLFSATNMPLIVYIAFAYDLSMAQVLHLQPQLPKWANTDGFDIQARAEGNQTREQMQLMMQSLLADRFQLAVHKQSSEGPVYSLVLAKPGKTGPQLQPDAEPCSMESAPPAPDATPPSPPDRAAKLPTVCGLQMMRPSAPGRLRAGGKGVPIGLFAMYLTGPITGVDRPIIDNTGLSGAFDFVIEFTPQFNGPLPPGANFQPDPDGPTFLQALQEQLGLKLVPQTGTIDVFVVDHVEEPSPN